MATFSECFSRLKEAMLFLEDLLTSSSEAPDHFSRSEELMAEVRSLENRMKFLAAHTEKRNGDRFETVEE